MKVEGTIDGKPFYGDIVFGSRYEYVSDLGRRIGIALKEIRDEVDKEDDDSGAIKKERRQEEDISNQISRPMWGQSELKTGYDAGDWKT